tara:strand:- start:10402 stop:10743 length:342 start_codon:yes stop_codon:yes gene_type:complete
MMGLESLPCREELFGIGFALVAGAAKGFGHGEVDFEVFAVDMSGRRLCKLAVLREWEQSYMLTLFVRRQHVRVLNTSSVRFRCSRSGEMLLALVFAMCEGLAEASVRKFGKPL